MMRARFPSIISNARHILKSHSHNAKNQKEVPKGYVAVYVGESEMKRYVVPLTYLSQPSFLDLLRYAKEEYGYNHPMGGLTIPCNEEAFINITSRFNN
ncbi:auxin-responsive protein SAUR21-like [Chenopodium quinoa]|uniref:auxin-responsive protein SAUR21-like n=1 Tax=Chenopodium quinoa TaxID=63459 RepID=UPI000B78668E|nr:auxin-responsive protein SAUR21-like [Chenopodium quinoa]